MRLKHVREVNYFVISFKSDLNTNNSTKTYIWQKSIVKFDRLISDVETNKQIGLFHISVRKRSAESAANLSADTSAFLSVETEVGWVGEGKGR